MQLRFSSDLQHGNCTKTPLLHNPNKRAHLPCQLRACGGEAQVEGRPTARSPACARTKMVCPRMITTWYTRLGGSCAASQACHALQHVHVAGAVPGSGCPLVSAMCTAARLHACRQKSCRQKSCRLLKNNRWQEGLHLQNPAARWCSRQMPPATASWRSQTAAL